MINCLHLDIYFDRDTPLNRLFVLESFDDLNMALPSYFSLPFDISSKVEETNLQLSFIGMTIEKYPLGQAIFLLVNKSIFEENFFV